MKKTMLQLAAAVLLVVLGGGSIKAETIIDPELEAETGIEIEAETETETESETESESETELPIVPEPGFVVIGKQVLHEDFEELYRQNNDLIGWLNIGDIIDYPVMWKKDDNDFYLHNNFEKQPDGNGTIFMTKDNSLDPRDDIIMLFGHNMSSGKMFGQLRLFESYDYVKENPILCFRTIYDAHDVYYTPVAGFNASMKKDSWGYFDVTHIDFADDPDPDETESEDITGSETESEDITGSETESEGCLIDNSTEELTEEAEVDTEPGSAETEEPMEESESGTAEKPMEEPGSADIPETEAPETEENETEKSGEEKPRVSTQFQKFLDDISEVSLWTPLTDVTINDKLLVLVTCSYYHEDGRFMLYCRQLREDETPEMIVDLYSGNVTVY